MDFKTSGKKVIGLTGGISSGKSTALEIFQRLGAEVICADKLAAKYFNVMRAKIKEYFNTDDKKIIASQVFVNSPQRKWLEGKLHPMILGEASRIIAETPKSVIIFDLPLLFEAGLEDSFDLTLCIYADYKTRLRRAAAKGFDEQDFKRRDAAQELLESKAQRADIVFYNNANQKALADKTLRFYKTLTK